MTTYLIRVNLGIRARTIDLTENVLERSYWKTIISSTGPGCME